MAEEIKATTNDGQTGSQGQAQGEGASRSEQRQKDLADKLAEQERVHSLQIEEERKAREKAEAESRENKFRADLLESSSKYPKAMEFKDEIKSYADKGLSVEDATALVLSKKGAFQTNQDTQRSAADASSFGGSAVTTPSDGQKSPSEMTQEERRNELARLEREGKFGVDPDKGIFVQ